MNHKAHSKKKVTGHFYESTWVQGKLPTPTVSRQNGGISSNLLNFSEICHVWKSVL